ncbi:MAG: SET domain-containing protein [Myxococcales bacterium]|nr:SET domain-containing protein [Myxococcales bacterium]MCB9643530.1 SET domain-containing protein [Myxococcales bacterium]
MTETKPPQENSASTLSQEESQPPAFPEHLRQEALEFAKKSEAFIKSLDVLTAPYRELIAAMEKERELYRQWRQEHEPTISYDSLETYQASLYMPKAEIRESPGMGRGLFATQDLVKGELIVAEAPLVSAFSLENQVLSGFLGMFANPWSLTLAVLQQEPAQRALCALLSNAHQDKTEALRGNLEFFQQAWPEEYPDAPTDELIQWMERFQTNSFVVPHKYHKKTAAYLVVAMLNHACLPNATFAFEDETIVVHAQLDIPQGEQIFTSYLQRPSLPVDRRQSMLLERFGFACRCPTCVEQLAAS